MRLTEKSETILRRAELAAGLALTLLLVYLHFSFMRSAGSLWRDEIHTFRLATMPSIADMWAAMNLDSFPAFTNVALRLWTGIGFGGDDPGLRLFGFLLALIIAALGSTDGSSTVRCRSYPFSSSLSVLLRYAFAIPSGLTGLLSSS